VERNIALWVAYDGSAFHGWQRQPDLRTVQEVLTQAARRVVRHQVELVGSGRTDAGVHATGQVAHMFTDCAIPPSRLRYAMGARLPKDLSIIHLRRVHPAFHATRSATSKLYRYRVHNARRRPVEHLTHPHVYHFWQPLDADAMLEAAVHLLGTRDFTSMATKGAERESMVRTVLRCDVERFGPEIRFSVEGRGFLYNQVRNMVGTLMEVGRGRWKPDDVVNILEARDRSVAGPTAPARGLCLQWVHYPAELLRPPGGADDPGGATPDGDDSEDGLLPCPPADV
jgi:tRNA pseudouridine38-40 synthase